MHAVTLAQLYGFEGTAAAKLFMVGFAGLALVAAVLIRLSLLQWLLVGVLFANALTAPTNYERTQYIITWISPLQIHRAEAHLALGILLSILVVVTGKLRSQDVPIQGLLMLAIALYAGMLQFFHDSPVEASKSIGFALATIPCMLFATPAAARTHEDCVRLLRSLMWVSVLWTVCCSVQFVINPKNLVNLQGRFWGMLGNAQQAGMLTAPFVVIALWLLLNDKVRRLRLLWIALIAINLLFLGWTGSRTGALMLVMGLMFVLYNRMGKMILLLPFAVVMFFGLSYLAKELQIGSNLERLVSTENTRTAVWARQLANIADKPLVGVGWKDSGGSESSWLGGFAGYGVGMFLLMVALLAYSVWMCMRFQLRRRQFPVESRPLIDLFCSWNAMYFTVATFEGIMLGRSSAPQTTMLIFAGIGVHLTNVLASQRIEADREVFADDASYHDEYQAADAGYADVPDGAHGHAY